MKNEKIVIPRISKGKKLAYKVVLCLITALAYMFFGMPVLNYGFTGIGIMLLLLIGVWNLVDFALSDFLKFEVSSLTGAGLLISGIYIFILPGLTSWALFRNSDYRALIGNVKNGENFSKQIEPISIEKIRVVDEDLAYILGDKVLGEQPALGSMVKLGSFTIQKVRNELFWVAPLLHSGFFKWQQNMEGTPGYVMVSATNERDVRLVQKIEGKPVFLKYQPEAFFMQYLERYVYFHGFMTTGLTDYSFEIDDDGEPFWVITKYKKNVGFSGDDATGVVTVNAQTGAIKEYALKDAPKWIDRIHPSEFIADQMGNWGEFVHGYWNFSNQDKLKVTANPILVYGHDERSYWYMGLSSVGSDEATVGFVLVDTRTKEAIWYHQSGATEFAAQKSAMGKVQEKGYTASDVLPYNINNIPTYIMTLKDRGGLVKMFAMVAIEDYTVVGVGNTLREAQIAFKNSYNMSKNRITAHGQTQKIKIASTVSRISNDIRNGNSVYYFMLNSQNKIFLGSSQISTDIPITMVGDSVEISFDDDAQDVIDISGFKNMSFRKK